MTADSRLWIDRAEALAFLGNSLLDTMNSTGDEGLNPAFWQAFPSCDSSQVSQALDACTAWAMAAQGCGYDAQEESVEFTRLFVGPPSPAAPAWQTFYEKEGVNHGFGKATIEMRGLLREAGLELSNENRQYEDHIGIELLYASVLCQRASLGDEESAAKAASFAKEFPLTWIDALMERVSQHCPDGYVALVLSLSKALLMSLM